MQKKTTKPAKSSAEHDSIRETRVLLEEMNQGIKMIGEQHGSIVKKLEEHDKRFDTMESELIIVKTDLGAVKTDLGAVKSDLGAVKTDLGTVKSELKSVKMAVMEVDAKVNKLDSKLDTNISQNEERFKRIETKLEVV
ncbi:MAG: hypothetical protein ABIH18_08385 [Candidatus Omnitrophota bacterium]